MRQTAANPLTFRSTGALDRSIGLARRSSEDDDDNDDDGLLCLGILVFNCFSHMTVVRASQRRVASFVRAFVRVFLPKPQAGEKPYAQAQLKTTGDGTVDVAFRSTLSLSLSPAQMVLHHTVLAPRDICTSLRAWIHMGHGWD